MKNKHVWHLHIISEVMLMALMLTGFGCTQNRFPTVSVDQTASVQTPPDPFVDEPVSSPSSTSSLVTSPPFSSGVPGLSLVSRQQITGAPVWPFIVQDDLGRLVLSSEKAGGIVMSQWRDSNVVGWRTILSPSDVGGGTIVDHWHIFAHGYHWIAVNLTDNRTSYLAKVSQELELVDVIQVTHDEKVSDRESITTNDLFLVDEEHGVTVGHFLPGIGHRLYRYDLNLQRLKTKDVGGGQARHANGSSAVRVADGFVIFATENLDPSQEGGIKLLRFDTQWNLLSTTDLITEQGKNISMATGVFFTDGSLLVHAKMLDVLPRIAPGSPLPDDSGAIIRWLFSSALEPYANETIAGDSARHPHTTLFGDQLLTVWDAQKTSWIRVEYILTDE